ncbi:hypothetical protein ACFQFH_08690 [Halobaculum halobium]|uniref:hypothetical protein n=1 Tax=Halobaculum halobium TaxID=3032281 RepID=UPI0036236CA7
MSLIDTLRRPEYTGENRCGPCTVLNVAAVVVAAAVAATRRRSLAVPVVAVGAALVYLRGYVVPGTPAFAPDLVRSLGMEDRFRHVAVDGGDPERRRESDDLVADTDPQELLGAMFRHGVIEEGEGGDDALYLTEAFETAWREEMETLRAATPDDLVEATAEVVPFEGTGERKYDGVAVEGEGVQFGSSRRTPPATWPPCARWRAWTCRRRFARRRRRRCGCSRPSVPPAAATSMSAPSPTAAAAGRWDSTTLRRETCSRVSTAMRKYTCSTTAATMPTCDRRRRCRSRNRSRGRASPGRKRLVPAA